VSRAVRAAVIAGTAVRVLRVLFAPAAAAAVAAGAGEVIGHVFGRGLSGWTALAIGGAFALWISAELNSVPPAPPGRSDEQGI
jgi:hypothetical protein